ncbi:MAG: transglycosylase domain-containing protein, partial [Advenella sp.]
MTATPAGMAVRRRRRTRLAGFCLLVGLACAVALVICVARLPVPAYDEVRNNYRTSYITLLDRDGAVLERVRRDYHDRRDNWTPLTEVSPALINAVLQSEDRRFYRHMGVDVLALAGSLRDRLIHRSVRGSSTLTMQLAGMLERDKRQFGRRTPLQKVRQMGQALALELHWNKSQILEAYLNMVPWRGELSGITATARSLFGKYPSGLDSRESAILAAMLRAPNAVPSTVSKRACGILKMQSQAQYCDYLAGFTEYHLMHTSSTLQDDPFAASHFARRRLALDMPRKEQIGTSIDGQLQRTVQTIVNRVAHQIRRSHANDAAAVVLDNRTGHILAYVGSSGDLATARYVDNATAMRQAGSTLKPFLYGQALEQRRITAASLLDDSAVNLPTGNGLYVPQNYDKQFGGWVSARTALASSLNIPAVRLLVMVTPDVFHQRLLQLGLPLSESGDYYGYSLALGSADVTLLSLTNAYRALANRGVYSDVDWGAGAAPAGSRIM